MRWTAVIELDTPADWDATQTGQHITRALTAGHPELIPQTITVHSGTIYHGPVHPEQRWEDHHPLIQRSHP